MPTKSDYFKGAFLTLDGGPVIDAPIRKSTPPPPPVKDFRAFIVRLEAAQRSLDNTVKAYRNTRR